MARSENSAASRGCITGCSSRNRTLAERTESEMRKLPTAMPTTRLDRRHFLAALGAGLIATPRAFAGSSPDLIGQRLAQAEQDGKVSGLHALLISQGGKLVFEH